MTRFFEDGFESGDFSAWASVSPYGGGTASVIEAAARSGVYGAEIVVPLPAINTEWAGAWIQWLPAGQLELFSRGYFYIADNFPMAVNSRFYIMQVMQVLDYETLVQVGIGNQEGDGLPHWRLIARNGIEYISVWGGLVPTTPEPICVEIRIVRDAVNGLVELYVNDVLEAEIPGIDTTQILMERIRFGGEVPPVSPDYPGNANFNPLRVSFDDCVIADQYIGLDLAPTIYMITLQTNPAGGIYVQPSATSPFTVNVDAGNQLIMEVPATWGEYGFDHWEADGIVMGSANPATIVVNSNITYTAVYTTEPTPPPEDELSGPLGIWTFPIVRWLDVLFPSAGVKTRALTVLEDFKERLKQTT